jgi:hypothetical protein
MTQHEAGTVRTDVPSRLDRLPWARWHWLVLVGLGTVWIPLSGSRSRSSARSATGSPSPTAESHFFLASAGARAGPVALGYYLGAAVMILGGLAEVFLGVDAEQKSLEDVAEPLSAELT